MNDRKVPKPAYRVSRAESSIADIRSNSDPRSLGAWTSASGLAGAQRSRRASGRARSPLQASGRARLSCPVVTMLGFAEGQASPRRRLPRQGHLAGEHEDTDSGREPF